MTSRKCVLVVGGAVVGVTLCGCSLQGQWAIENRGWWREHYERFCLPWGGAFFNVALAQTPVAAGKEVDVSVSSVDTTLSKASIPSGSSEIQKRFLQYAQMNPITGEYVLSRDDFVACMLRMPSPSVIEGESSTGQTAADRSRAMGQLPLHVQRRMTHFFHLVDVNASNDINYAEFVLLFTLLSTRRETLRTAFQLFGEDSSSRLNEVEVTRLLNTLMVDPAVQVYYDGDHAAAQRMTSMQKGLKYTKGKVDVGDVAVVSSVAASTRKIKHQRAKGKNDFTYFVPSSMLLSILMRPLPPHLEAPPGSRHHHGRFAQILEGWKRCTHVPATAPTAPGEISFDDFWLRMDYLRWELRAVEFGSYDPQNKGTIRLADFQQMLSLGASDSPADAAVPCGHGLDKLRSASLALRIEGSDEAAVRSKDPGVRAHEESDSTAISWQFYQTVFDVIRESERVLRGLELALHAQPPIPAETLEGGATPCYVSVSPTSLPHENSVRTDVEMKRPTALNREQFARVLNTCDDIPKLTDEEHRLLFDTLDVDRSGTITPAKFAEVCRLRSTFFATYMPRFTEPRRNALQNFFLCMQQLE